MRAMQLSTLHRDRDERLREWLTHVLGAGPFTLEPLAGDASARRYLRLRGERGTFVVMDAPPPENDLDAFVRVDELLAGAGVTVPEVHAVDRPNGFALLGDLGSELYLDVLTEATADRLYRDAIEALVTIQTRAEATTLSAYDLDFLDREMALFPRWFLTIHLGLPIGDRHARLIREASAWLAEQALEQPTVFMHRDYHSRNLMQGRSRNPGVLDFQDAVRGPIAYDLVSLLRDVYVRWEESHISRWINHYYQLSRRHQLLADVSIEQLVRWFDLVGVQRHLKVAGIFSRLCHRDGKPGYLQDIPLALSYLRAQCARYRELRGLGAVLDEIEVEPRLAEANERALRQHSRPAGRGARC